MLKKSLLLLLTLSCLSTSQAQERREQRGIFGAGQPAEMTVVRKEVKKMGLENFDLQSRQVDGRLAIDGFSARLGTGTIQGQGLVDWSRQNDRHHLNIRFDNVDVATLFSAFEIKVNSRLQGQASGTIQCEWNGVRGTTPRETMNGRISIKIGPGSISNARILTQLAQYTGISALQTVEFTSAEIEGTIRNGMMSITAANLNGSTKSAVGQGLLDLRSEDARIKFDISVNASLAKQSSVPAIKTAGDRAGNAKIKLPVPVVLYGKIRQPEFDFALQ